MPGSGSDAPKETAVTATERAQMEHAGSAPGLGVGLEMV